MLLQGGGPDVEKLDAARHAYEAAGLEVAHDMASKRKLVWTTLGTAVRAGSGRVGVPSERRRLMSRTSLQLASLTRATRSALEEWSGLLAPILFHRRGTLSVLHRFYLWLARLPRKGSAVIPSYIREEIVGAGLMSIMAGRHEAGHRCYPHRHGFGGD